MPPAWEEIGLPTAEFAADPRADPDAASATGVGLEAGPVVVMGMAADAAAGEPVPELVTPGVPPGGAVVIDDVANRD